MTPGARRAKGRRLPVQVAEALAEAFKLTIEATHPKFAGKKRGVLYVPEGHDADLRIKGSGQVGADVVIVSKAARKALYVKTLHRTNRGLVHYGDDDLGLPMIECKNTEGWSIDAQFWRTGKLPAIIRKALKQAKGHGGPEKGRASGVLRPLYFPVVICSRNLWPALVVMRRPSASVHGYGEAPMLLGRPNLMVTTLDSWIEWLVRSTKNSA